MNPRALAAAGYAAIAACCLPFWLPLLRAGVYVGNGTDLYSYQLPMRRLVVATLAAGELPLWNASMLTGVPLLGAWQLGLLYPPSWLGFGLGALGGVDAGFALDLERALHGLWLVLGGVALGNALTPQPLLLPTARGLAVALLLGGAGVTWGHIYAGHTSFLAVWAWLPWAWALTLRVLTLGWRPWLPWATAAFAMALLAGHPQLVMIGAVGLGIASLGTIGPTGPRSIPAVAAGATQRLLRQVGLLAAIAAGAAALAAVQLLPTAALLEHLNRGLDEGKVLGLAFSAPTASLLTMLAPFSFGAPEARAAAFSWHEAVGALPAALVALALVGPPRRVALVAWAGALGLATFVPGEHLPVLPAAIELLPPLGAFRVPSRWHVAIALLLALALAEAVGSWLAPAAAAGARDVPSHATRGAQLRAASGPLLLALATLALAAAVTGEASWWRESIAARVEAVARGALAAATGARLLAVAALAVAVAIATALPRLRRPALALVVIAAAYDGWALASAVQPEAQMWPRARLAWPEPLAAALRRSVGADAAAGARADASGAAGDPLAGRLVTAPSLRQANWGGGHGVDVVGGYETALPLWTNRAFNAANGKEQTSYVVNLQLRRASPWLDRAAARALLRRADDRGAAAGFATWPAGAAADGVVLHRNPGALPRLGLAARVEVESDRAAAIARIGDLPRDVILLDRPLPAVTARAAAPGDVLRLVEDRNAAVEASLQLAAPAVVVLRDAWLPGWRATLDGGEVEVAIADGLYRAVAVPAGAHRLRFSYQPPGLALGLGISVAAWLLLVAWLWRERRRSPWAASTPSGRSSNLTKPSPLTQSGMPNAR